MFAIFKNPYLQQVPFLILIVVVWYFFFLRPGNKEKESKRDFFANLKVGDSIVTLGGIHGVIIDLQDKQVIIGVGNTKSSQIKIQKEAISVEVTQQVYPKASSKEEVSQKEGVSQKVTTKTTKPSLDTKKTTKEKS